MTRIDTDGRVRFCDSCERPVYDSAAMTRDELFDLIAWHEGQRLPCIRLHRRPDGTIVTRNCFEPFIRVGRFVWLKVGLAAVAFWSWILGVHPLLRRYVASRTSSEEIDLRSLDYSVMQGMVSIQRPTKPAEEVNSMARTPGSNGWRGLPDVDRAPPLRMLEIEEEIWNARHKRDD
jgi:hypothetical protein